MKVPGLRGRETQSEGLDESGGIFNGRNEENYEDVDEGDPLSNGN